MTAQDKVPVTILTGFLGSGKTTLLNRILSEEHGKRIAVIENEYGEVGIDQALVINADEEIFEMSNGCICCTVRGDLIRVLGNLMKRRDKFDYVLVETTGLADPGPVAQTFFMDDEIREEFALDGIVTLVDAAHIEQQLGRSDESGGGRGRRGRSASARRTRRSAGRKTKTGGGGGHLKQPARNRSRRRRACR